MSDIESQQEQQTIHQISAQLVHDIATPLVAIQMLADMLDTYLPITFAAYQQLKARGEVVDEIPQDQYQALESAATRIKALAQHINHVAKESWQQIDQQTCSQITELPSVNQARAIALENSLRILVAEDDDIHQKIAFKLLSGQHQVDIAKNGREAVEHCRQHTYDLVLMDLHMPVMDGVQAAAEIMQLPVPPQLIIGLTNRPLGSERKQLLQQGFAGFIEKPLRLDELKGAISRRGSSISSSGSIELL